MVSDNLKKINFRHRGTSITPSKTFLARVVDDCTTRCLGTYQTEEEAAKVVANYKMNRLRRICKEHGHDLEDGVVIEKYYVLFINGDIFVVDTAHKLTPHPNGAGYLSVSLNGHPRRIHRLIAENFIPNPLNKPCVNHIDGNKLNNNISNLEWCTQSENVKHAFATGLKVPANLKAEDCPWSRLCWDDIHYIRDNYIPRDPEFGQRALSEKFDISQQMVSSIIKNERWVDDNYEYTNKQKQTSFLYSYQLDAVNRLRNGRILCGGVGSGKSRTGLFYYFKENGGWIDKDKYTPMKDPQDLIIISTALKRDSKEWLGELANFALYPDENGITRFGNKIIVDSWNNIKKYQDVKDSFFLLDEQRLVSYGAWTKAFLKIAKNNNWILLSATPGDSFIDYLPVFLANGFYKNKTEFNREHVIFSRYTKFPKIDRFVNTRRLERLRDQILVDMDYEHDIRKHHEDILCSYDTRLYKNTIKNRWDYFKEEPVRDAGGLCYVLRRVVNSDESRQVRLLEILEDHPRAIIFYNFNYERDILLNLAYEEGTKIAEWSGNAHQPVPDGDRWVYLVQYTAGAEGWNCIRTNCTIFFSQNYSYKIVTQAAGRIDRLNSPFDDLFYYHLKSKSGIDLAISRALHEKKKFNERKWCKWN